MATNPYYHSTHWRRLRQQCLERDGWTCVVDGCHAIARVVDHIIARPLTSLPCAEDRLGNLRSLCLEHDAQVKEIRRGDSYRKQGGAFRIRGCDVDGVPLDPKRR